MSGELQDLEPLVPQEQTMEELEAQRRQQAAAERKQRKILAKIGYSEPQKLTDTLQGSIWRAFQNSTKGNVVIKITNRKLSNANTMVLNGLEYRVEENIKQEQAILKYLTSNEKCVDSIVKFNDFVKSNVNYYLVMEDGGTSLFDFVSQVHNYVDDGQIEYSEWLILCKKLFKQMIEAVEYIHSQSICHFDISLENFLIDSVDVEMHNDKLKFCEDSKPQVKLCDFGLAGLFPEKSNFQSNKFVGKLNCMSPELLRKESFNAKSNDVWCLGICLFMMIIGGCPWDKASKTEESFNKMMDGQIIEILEFWKKVDCVNKDIINVFKLFFKYEDERATLEEIKRSAWFQEKGE